MHLTLARILTVGLFIGLLATGFATAPVRAADRTLHLYGTVSGWGDTPGTIGPPPPAPPGRARGRGRPPPPPAPRGAWGSALWGPASLPPSGCAGARRREPQNVSSRRDPERRSRSRFSTPLRDHPAAPPCSSAWAGRFAPGMGPTPARWRVHARADLGA